MLTASNVIDSVIAATFNPQSFNKISITERKRQEDSVSYVVTQINADCIRRCFYCNLYVTVNFQKLICVLSSKSRLSGNGSRKI
jgi:hypothetical protein